MRNLREATRYLFKAPPRKDKKGRNVIYSDVGHDIQDYGNLINDKFKEHYKYKDPTDMVNKQKIFIKYLVYRLSRHFPVDVRKKILTQFGYNDWDFYDRVRIFRDISGILHEFMHLALYEYSFELFAYQNVKEKVNNFNPTKSSASYLFLEELVANFLDGIKRGEYIRKEGEHMLSQIIHTLIRIIANESPDLKLVDKMKSIYTIDEEKKAYARFVYYFFKEAENILNSFDSVKRLWQLIDKSLKKRYGSNYIEKVKDEVVDAAISHKRLVPDVKERVQNAMSYALTGRVAQITPKNVDTSKLTLNRQMYEMPKSSEEEIPIIDKAFAIFPDKVGKIMYNLVADLREIYNKIDDILEAIDRGVRKS